MIIFENAVAHPFPAGHIPGAFNIIRIVGDFFQKNHPGFFIQRVVGDAIPPDPVAA